MGRRYTVSEHGLDRKLDFPTCRTGQRLGNVDILNSKHRLATDVLTET